MYLSKNLSTCLLTLSMKVPIHGDTDSDWTETSQEFSVPVLNKNGSTHKKFHPSVIQG